MHTHFQPGITTSEIGLDLSGALYYVSNSSRQRGAFLDDIDCAEFLSALSTTFVKRDWRCYGYCLVPDEYHLLVQTPAADLSQGVHCIQNTYASLFRRRYHVVRARFWNRYRLFFVDGRDFLLPVHRHVIRKPLELRMVRSVVQWRWSSYGAMVGQTSPHDWLETSEILQRFSRLRAMALRRYRAFIQEPTEGSALHEARHGMFLGTEPYVRTTLAALCRKNSASRLSASRPAAHRWFD